MVTTRREAMQLEYTYPLPKVDEDGKRKTFEEVFINSGGERTAQGAMVHLRRIQEGNTARDGWHSALGHEGVFQDTDGLWYAFRHHAKYR